jgi:hypothetical protein
MLDGKETRAETAANQHCGIRSEVQPELISAQVCLILHETVLHQTAADRVINFLKTWSRRNHHLVMRVSKIRYLHVVASSITIFSNKSIVPCDILACAVASVDFPIARNGQQIIGNENHFTVPKISRNNRTLSSAVRLQGFNCILAKTFHLNILDGYRTVRRLRNGINFRARFCNQCNCDGAEARSWLTQRVGERIFDGIVRRNWAKGDARTHERKFRSCSEAYSLGPFQFPSRMGQ